MNRVTLIGRLTKDPMTNQEKTVSKFTLAVDRNTKEKQADFINCVTFGKTAEFVDKYLSKGRQIGVEGRIQTGSYKNKDGQTIYTTDVVAERIEFCGNGGGSNAPKEEENVKADNSSAANNFSAVEEDIPF